MAKETRNKKHDSLLEESGLRKVLNVPDTIKEYLPGIVLASTLIALCYHFSAIMLEYFKWAALSVGFPFPIDYGEGPLLDQILRLAHFENIYRSNFVGRPYTVSNYPPLFMLMQVPLYWLFGLALWYGRMISIICVFVTAFFIFLTIFALTREWMASIIGGLLLICFPYIRQWSVFSRIDGLALALSWAAIYVTVRYAGQDDSRLQKRGYLLAVFLFIGAIYTRQTYALTAPFAAMTWLIFRSQGKVKSRIWPAVKLGLAIYGISLGLFLMVNIFTHGGFYFNIVVSNINPFYWETVYRHMQEIRGSFYPLLIIAGFFCCLNLWIKNARSQIWPLAVSYLVAAIAVATTIGKTGSSVNYLFEFCAALSFIVGASMAWVGRLKWGGKIWIQIVLLVIITFQLTSLVEWNGIDFSGFGDYLTKRCHEDRVERLARIVNKTRGIVLADEYMGLIPLAGKELYFEPFEFKQLVEAGIVDETSFVRELKQGKFDVILLYNPYWWPAVLMRWTQAQINALKMSYRVDEVIGNVYVLRPIEKKLF